MLTRRQFLLGLGGSLAVCAGGASYARGIEPRWLRVSRHHVPLNNGGGFAPIRLLQLSDLHASPVVSLDFIAESIALGLAQKPDVIALTGDFFTGRLQERERYSEILSRLSAAAPTFACLGNHDGGVWAGQRGGAPSIDDTIALLGGAGVTCLVNGTAALSIRGRPVQMIGVADLWSGRLNPAQAFFQLAPRGDAIRVVLCHNPDAKDQFKRFDWDVMLCGHTHGGQIRLPVIGTPFAPVRDQRYVEGLHRWENRWLHITRGVGNLHGVRFNCRPEVSVLTLDSSLV